MNTTVTNQEAPVSIPVIDAADVVTAVTHVKVPVTNDTGIMPAFKNIVNLPAVVMPTPEPAPAPEAPKKPKVMIADLFSGLLRDAGHANPEAWKETPFGSIHPDHVYCDEPLQRFHVNRQLRIILGKASQVLGVDTINMRGMLMDEQDVTAREWSAPVKNSIVPFFIKHNLPVSTAEVE